MKEQIKAYLIEKGLSNRETYVDIYNKFPAKGTNRTNKQKSDYIRGIRRKLINKGLLTNNDSPNILLFDIETAPMMGYFWQLWQQSFSPKSGKIKGEVYMICWAAKWLYETDTFSNRLSPSESKSENDYRIVKSLWDVLDKADYVIAHNAPFDTKTFNARCFKHGLFPPSPYKVICTLSGTKGNIKLPSYALDYISTYIEKDNKIKTNFSLWKGCKDGDIKSLIKMDTYCQGDIPPLEQVYLRLRPWIKSHPNINIIVDEHTENCPVCTSKDLTVLSKPYRTNTNAYEALRCNNCGKVTRRSKSILSKEERQVKLK